MATNASQLWLATQRQRKKIDMPDRTSLRIIIVKDSVKVHTLIFVNIFITFSSSVVETLCWIKFIDLILSNKSMHVKKYNDQSNHLPSTSN